MALLKTMGMEAFLKSSATGRKFDTEEEAEDALDEAREELEEKIKERKEQRIIAAHVKEINKLNRFSALLDCETKEEAMDMAETDEERDFIEENY